MKISEIYVLSAHLVGNLLMNNKNNLRNVEKLLKKHNQDHILAFWGQLHENQRQNLLTQINELDFKAIDTWIQRYIKTTPTVASLCNLAPSPFYPAVPASTDQQKLYKKATQFGTELISAGKVAAFIVAGGQGTRLGFDSPKGDFHISPVKNKTLFRIFAETIAAASKKYNTICPWYIMTSPLNHEQTKTIFRSNDFYGLDPANIFIFQQGTLPNFSFDGKILMADKSTIASSPDGHGGSLKALYKSGAIDDMKKRGIEFISYFQVDNPLINIFDPLFVGLHACDKAEISSKAVLKTDPKEKVGVFGLVDGKVSVIEYSDLPDELIHKRNPDGSLFFNLGSIAIHIINRAFVEKLNAKGFSLPLHRAVKKIQHIDNEGKLIEPKKPNGIKLESFVFDALPLASKSIILETLRNEEFAPVKNASGTDSPETSKALMVARAANWLESAGCAVPRKPDGSPDCLIEIAPGFALEKYDVKAKIKLIPQIKPKDKIYLA